MPKPKGTCGATKMKILAIMALDTGMGKESYGYDIWRRLKDSFYTYMDDNDVRNVYHHLNDLCSVGYIAKCREDEECSKCYYALTPMGSGLRHRYQRFLDILEATAASGSGQV